jgi:ABC-type branched-subunit amino acid transport system ATPase component
LIACWFVMAKLLDQNIKGALGIADPVYVMRTARCSREGCAKR